MSVEIVSAAAAILGGFAIVATAAWNVAERLARIETMLKTLPCKLGSTTEEQHACGRQ